MNSSPGQRPGISVNKNQPTLKALANSIPHVALVIINSILLKEGSILVLERNSTMMLLLRLNVSENLFQM